MPLSPHQVIDHYEILAPLGAGGMGEVYRARDMRLNRDVAIKVLPGLYSTDAERLRRFEQEARAAAALNHPNILVVYQMGMFEGAPYLVSELLEGETLRERLKRGPVPVRKVIDYGAQLARGLAAAHEKGIIHRDLKPENIFLTKDGQVKILDFGLARLLELKQLEFTKPAHEAQTVAGMLLGTVGYMSPEQVRGEPADQRSDIFAFSAVLHEMLVGQRTFMKQTSVETMSAILNEEPPSIAHLAPNTPIGLQRVLQRGLEKNPEQRFQSASDLGFALEALSDSAATSLSGTYTVEAKQSVRSRGFWVGLGAGVLVLLVVSIYFVTRPAPTPQVSNYVQLTHDGAQKSLIGTDGSRLFLTLVNSSVEEAAALQISGGEATRIIMPGPNMAPVAVSPDGSSFFVVDGRGYPAIGPLWSLPVLGASPRRLGDAQGQAASLSADGKTLAFANGTDVYLAKPDGTESRKLFTAKTFVSDLVWSPDGGHLRIGTTEITQSGSTTAIVGEQSIWEVAADGSNPHRLLEGWKNASAECCGKWTADGKFFVFQSQGQIWALPAAGRFFQTDPQPIQLTSSPMSLHSPLPSKDGKKLFVVGRTYRGELTRFDLKSGQQSPFLGGMSADWLDVSRDGTLVAFVSYPQGDLWRSKVDGTERVQLTFGAMRPVLPSWSPDGKTIVFFQFPNGPSQPGHIFQVSSEGGTPRELMPNDPHNQQDPSWSPDGKRFVFAGDAGDAAASTGPAIRIFDVQTGQLSSVPDSKRLFSPRWSPDGRYIAALTSDSNTIMLFDSQSQKWTDLAKGTLSWPKWSRDNQFLFVKNLSGRGSLDRIRISDRKVDAVIDLQDIVTTGLGGGSFSLAPDGSPLLLRDRGTQDVYALDWVQP